MSPAAPAQRILLLIMFLTAALILVLLLLGRQTERWETRAEGYGWSPLVERWLWNGHEEGRICELLEDVFEDEGWWAEVLGHQALFTPVGLHSGRPSFAPSPYEYAVEFDLSCRLNAPRMWFPIPSHDEVHVVLADAFAANLRRIQGQSNHEARIELHDPEMNARELTYTHADVISGTLQLEATLLGADSDSPAFVVELRILEATRDFVGPRPSPTSAPPTATTTPSVTPSPWPTSEFPLPPELALTATALFEGLFATPPPPPPPPNP